jgi:hypothetical protein
MMEILQQKLIWFLGATSIYLLQWKFEFGRLVAGKETAVRIKTGTLLILVGTLIGILTRMGLLGQWLLQSGVSFYIENIFGYLLGWSLLIWGIISWSKEYFDVHGRPLTNTRQRVFSDKISASIINGLSETAYLESISRYLLLALDCQAITLHRQEKGESIFLTFQEGLMPDGEVLLNRPHTDSFFARVIGQASPVATDDPGELHSTLSVQSSYGPIISTIGLPFVLDENATLILSAYSVRKKFFSDDDIELLKNMASGLEIVIKREKAESESRTRIMFQEMLQSVDHSFDKEKQLVSALLQSARTIFANFPFTEINLYTTTNGAVNLLDFKLPSGGQVNLRSGYFKKSEYPFLYPSKKQKLENKSPHDAEIFMLTERSSCLLLLRLEGLAKAWLEIKYSGKGFPAYLPILMATLGEKIARKLEIEQAVKLKEQAGQWLGAIQFYLEQARSTSDVAELLHEMASMAVNAGTTAFCKITLSDPQKSILRTAALAQARDLRWSMQHLLSVPVSKVELHGMALLNRIRVSFDQDDPHQSISESELSFLMPQGIKRGEILPLVIGDHAVGLLTVGDFREKERAYPSELMNLFWSNLAGLMSLVLTWQKEKRLTGEIKEGARKLTMIQRETHKNIHDIEFAPKMRSQINGPLAGILASCEYLKDSHPEIESDIGRLINVIQRNASKIHEITAGVAAQ